MIKTKNNSVFIRQFVLFITIILVASCASKKYEVYKIEGKKIGVTTTIEPNEELERFVLPYRTHITKDLDSVLAYCPEILDKSKGEWQTNIGNFMADVCLKNGSYVFNLKHKKTADICLLNNGGIRSIIPKGNVTARTAFEVMPFENNLFIIALKGHQIEEMANHIILEKKPHPLAGMKFHINKEKKASNITVQGSPLDLEKIYYVATSDYLSNGGDNMTFFMNNSGSFDLDYKIRNVLIDYFKKVDTIIASPEIRIIVD